MAENSKIEWTDATWNIITGCTLVDEGCRNCYAAHLIASWPAIGNHPSRKGLARKNAAGEAKFTGEVRFNEAWLDQPLRWKKPRRIFVCAHGDLFHESVPDEWIDRVFAVMALCPQHTFQVLTKRPERMREYLTVPGRVGDVLDAALALHHEKGATHPRLIEDGIQLLTLPNVWLGTSVSDQASADLRIPHLLATPAAVRFLSVEPMLGPVDLTRWSGIEGDGGAMGFGIDWVICGGESGPGARPMHPDWARCLRDQCTAAGVAFFFKQWGEWGSAAPKPSGTPGKYAIASAGPDSAFWPQSVIPIDSYPRQINLFGGARVMERIGKARAGRQLDGQTWDQMPGVNHG